jgi:hypothetical protein
MLIFAFDRRAIAKREESASPRVGIIRSPRRPSLLRGQAAPNGNRRGNRRLAIGLVPGVASNADAADKLVKLL